MLGFVYVQPPAVHVPPVSVDSWEFTLSKYSYLSRQRTVKKKTTEYYMDLFYLQHLYMVSKH